MWSANANLSELAGHIVDRAWRVGLGVRVYRWPCGVCVVVRVDSPADCTLMRDCVDCLFMTCARGVMLSHVLDSLRWAQGRAA